jgi:transcription termination/antitermination protein NusG
MAPTTEKINSEANWYVIHTYSGYENRVAEDLQKRAKSFKLEDQILEVLVPEEQRIKVQNGKRRTTTERIYPSYILVKMIISNRSWYIVRNTPGVTGFLGTGSTPVPVSPEEMETLKEKMSHQEPQMKIDFELGSLVEITDGPFKGFSGKVIEINPEKGKIKVAVDAFGRETPVELDSLQVKRV